MNITSFVDHSKKPHILENSIKKDLITFIYGSPPANSQILLGTLSVTQLHDAFTR